MPARILRVGFALLLLLVARAQAADVVVQASRHGDVLHIEASCRIDADAHDAWQVMTDYDRLSEFIPGMIASRVVTRAGRALVIEQKGEARLLWFRYPIEVTLAVEEFPYERITARAVAGNFKALTGIYHLDPRERPIRLRYSGRMTPDFFVPPLVGALILRRNVERQFSALIDEIVRRHQARHPAATDPG
jgi:ribosome-associated toxin RatA of RatAB toxin-antitoxin module